jgi:hypothetical protein
MPLSFAVSRRPDQACAMAWLRLVVGGCPRVPNVPMPSTHSLKGSITLQAGAAIQFVHHPRHGCKGAGLLRRLFSQAG